MKRESLESRGGKARVQAVLDLQRAAYSLALRVARTPEAAEEAVQEAYLHAIEKMRTSGPPHEIRPWFLKVVVNAARMARRSEKRRAAHEGRVRPPPREAPPDAENLAAVREALGGIEERHRLAVALCCEQGLTRREAAEVLGWPEGTVATCTRRGLERLRSALARAGYALALPALGEILRTATAEQVPPALAQSIGKIAAGAALSSAGAVGGGAGSLVAAAKGGIAMKILAGVVLAGAVAAGVAVVSGGGDGLPAEKVPGKDYPYGEGTVYRQEVLYHNPSHGELDGPAAEFETMWTTANPAPGGDWYLCDGQGGFGGQGRVIYRYDAKRKMMLTLNPGCPYGKRGGTIDALRTGGNGYWSAGMDVSAEGGPDGPGKYLTVSDGQNRVRYRADLKTGLLEPAPDVTAAILKGAVWTSKAPDGAVYFVMGDGKLKKLLPDEKTVQDLGVTLEGPLKYGLCFVVRVSEKTGRLYASATQDGNNHSPWGVVWYWDMKTGKGVPVAGPKRGEKPDPKFRITSGPADKVSFWCNGAIFLGPDQGERYIYLAGGDEPRGSRIDLKKKYVTKAVPINLKDPNFWTFGDDKGHMQEVNAFGKYNFFWGRDGEFYSPGRSPQYGTMYVLRPVRK